VAWRVQCSTLELHTFVGIVADLGRWCSWRLVVVYVAGVRSSTTPSVSKYKMFKVCEANVSRHVLVYIFK
jgi:hypothetical protein